MLIDLKYSLNESGREKLSHFSLNFNDEQQEAIASSVGTIDITIDVDDIWGFVNIVAVNGNKI